MALLLFGFGLSFVTFPVPIMMPVNMILLI
jgi:hypothetical protein